MSPDSVWTRTILDDNDFRFLHSVLNEIKNDMDKLMELQRLGHIPLILDTLTSANMHEVVFSAYTLDVLTAVEPQLLYFNTIDTISKPDLNDGYHVLFGDINSYNLSAKFSV